MPTTARIEGNWRMIRAEASGEEAPELVIQRTELVLESGNYAVRFDGVVTDRGVFAADDTPPLKTLVLRGSSGPNAGRTIPAIYQLMGDRLRVCFGLDGVAPMGFSTTEGDARYLATYRRQQP